MQASRRTGFHTLSAPDAFRRYGNLLHGKRYRAGLLTGHTGGALLLLPPDPDQTEPVKPAIDRP